MGRLRSPDREDATCSDACSAGCTDDVTGGTCCGGNLGGPGPSPFMARLMNICENTVGSMGIRAGQRLRAPRPRCWRGGTWILVALSKSVGDIFGGNVAETTPGWRGRARRARRRGSCAGGQEKLVGDGPGGVCGFRRQATHARLGTSASSSDGVPRDRGQAEFLLEEATETSDREVIELWTCGQAKGPPRGSFKPGLCADCGMDYKKNMIAKQNRKVPRPVRDMCAGEADRPGKDGQRRRRLASGPGRGTTITTGTNPGPGNFPGGKGELLYQPGEQRRERPAAGRV